MWKKNEETETPSMASTAPRTPEAAPRGPASTSRSSGSPAIIGESIRVQGEIRGSEDLLVEGEVDGQVHLDDHSVTVGRSGRVKADIHGGVLVVEGKVQGNLYAREQAVVRASGEVRGNITSPRVSLEDGAKFKGSIDMEPRSTSGSSATTGQDRGDAKKSSGGKDSQGSSASKANGSSGSGGSGGNSKSPGGGPASGSGSSGGGDKSRKASSGAATP